MKLEILDFDNIADWSASLDSALFPLLSGSARKKLLSAKLEFIEDSQELLFAVAGRDAVIDTVLNWLYSKKLIGHHGTRITDAETDSIQSHGLIPLNGIDRRNRLIRVLSLHPKWNEVAHRLDEVILSLGPKEREGRREGQVHLTLSLDSLLRNFNHYLVYGSEFDQNAARELLGTDGLELLSRDGESKVVKVAIPGVAAVMAAHPIFSVDKVRSDGETPNIVNEITKFWSYRISHPNIHSRHLSIDCGMMFQEAIPADWIIDITPVKIPLGQSVF